MSKRVNSGQKYLVFDFDGTIADSLIVGVGLFNDLAESKGIKPLEFNDIDELRNQPLKSHLKTAKVPFWKLPFLLREFQKEIYKHMDDIPPFNGIEGILSQLHMSGYRIGLLTSNSEENVEVFMEKHSMGHLFDFMYFGASLWGKNRTIKKMIKEQKIQKEDILYIGDETRDIKGAQKAGVKVAAVSWGFSSHEFLSPYNPDYLFDKPSDLLSLIDHL
jgi:phosphoglycolate phosphatase-like HAD superfamily hydrolase